MPSWFLPTFTGLLAALVAFWLLGYLAAALGIPMTHKIPYIDSYGEYQESGSTRAGFFLAMVNLAFGAWAAGLVHTKRLSAGLTSRDWRFLRAIFGALAVYVAVMHVLTVTLERQTRGIPDFIFTILDLAILVGCGYGAFRLSSRGRN